MRSAIIDIGCNAIRAVVYESNKLGATEIFNQKFKNDLEDLLNSDTLDCKHSFYNTMGYLVYIFNRLLVIDIRCVATAILRGHIRSDELIEIVKKKFDIEVNVISGNREAYFTALGLISGTVNAIGIVADLGGGSLELARIIGDKVDMLKSMPLGTNLVNKNKIYDIKLLTQIIKEDFESIIFLDNLYLVGGAFRVIARSYMSYTHYPLKNLHNLEISGSEFNFYLNRLSYISSFNLIKDFKVDLTAIIIAKAIVKVFNPKNIIISNYGLKEGIRFFYLPLKEKKLDIIYEKIKSLVNFDDDFCKMQEYINLIKSILVDPDIIILSTIPLSIMLYQYNKNIDRTMRAKFIVEFILASDIPFSHRQRVILSVVLALSYSVRVESYLNRLAKKMLSRNDFYNSQIIGHALRIISILDGPLFSSPSFSFLIEDINTDITPIKVSSEIILKKVRNCLKNINFLRKNIY